MNTNPDIFTPFPSAVGCGCPPPVCGSARIHSSVTEGGRRLDEHPVTTRRAPRPRSPSIHFAARRRIRLPLPSRNHWRGAQMPNPKPLPPLLIKQPTRSTYRRYISLPHHSSSQATSKFQAPRRSLARSFVPNNLGADPRCG